MDILSYTKWITYKSNFLILFTKGHEHLITSNTPKLMAYPWRLMLDKATHPPDNTGGQGMEVDDFSLFSFYLDSYALR